MPNEFYYAKDCEEQSFEKRAEELRDRYGVSINTILYDTKSGGINIFYSV